jgi:hypothetical protein
MWTQGVEQLQGRPRMVPEDAVLRAIDDGIWSVSCGPLKCGRFHERHMSTAEACGRRKRHHVSPPLSPDFFVTDVPDRSGGLLLVVWHNHVLEHGKCFRLSVTSGICRWKSPE